MMHKFISVFVAIWFATISAAFAGGNGAQISATTPPLALEQDSGTAFIALTPSATINTKGAYSQLIASTTNITRNLLVTLAITVNQATPSTGWYIDVATGAAGSEIVLISNLILNTPSQYTNDGRTYLIPVNIPAGTRISARTAANIASATDAPGIQIVSYSGGFGSVGIDTIGSASGGFGTAITPGNGVKGSYAQLIASSSHAYKALFFALDTHGALPAQFNDCAIDISTGGAGSEVVVIPNIVFKFYNNIYPGNLGGTIYPVTSIPAGTRFAARAQCGGTNGTIGVTAFGVY